MQMGGESVTSNRSVRSTGASSQRSHKSAKSIESQRSQKSIGSKQSQKSSSSRRSSGTGGNTAGRDSPSLSEKLSHIDGKSGGNGSSSVTARSQKSTASASSKGTHKSSTSAHSQRSTSSRQSASSKKSSASNKSAGRGNVAKKLDKPLEQIAENRDVTLDGTSVSSWRSPYQASVQGSTDASSSVSDWSNSITTKSTRTSNESSIQDLPNKKKSGGASVGSQVSSRSNFAARGQQAEGIDYLESGNYRQAVLLFTQAVPFYQRHERGKEHQVRHALATLYGYRCEALYAVGAYDAAVRDAKNALDWEKRSHDAERMGINDQYPYEQDAGSKLLHPEKGAVLRAKVLCSLGYALLRGGHVEGMSEAFGDSISVAKKALEDAEDLTESERKSSTTHRVAVGLLIDTVDKSTEGLSLLNKYVSLMEKAGDKKKKHYVDVVDGILEIAPGSVEWHIAKVMHYVERRRWFAVANHCEQTAAVAAKYDGIFKLDLAEVDPFPGIPPMQELDANYFKESKRKAAPSHLRVLGTKATRDAVFRMPHELLPYYLRSLRLEERYKDAVLVGTALAEFDAQAKAEGTCSYAENKRYHEEWDKLDRTIKVKEEGDALFRDGCHEQALALYGECLAIDGDSDGGNSSILRQASSWPVACKKANASGGKLHAVLHSNRAACFSSMGRNEDAIKESSHAIEIHSMYTRAILRRARCYAKTGQEDLAKTDYNRYIILVEGAREFPYPPPNQGSPCYFDMPSVVSNQQLGAVKKEMNELGMKPVKTKGGKESKLKSLSTMFGRSKKMPNTGPRARSNRSSNRESNRSRLSSRRGLLCCRKKWVSSQVVSQRDMPSNWPTDDGEPTSQRGGIERTPSGRRVSFSGSPEPHNSSVIKSRPAFDHPLDPPQVFDSSLDYYEMLGLTSSASDAEIKHAYHKLARENHPDRNSSAEAQARFEDTKLAYAILGDENGRRREYDRASVRMSALDP